MSWFVGWRQECVEGGKKRDKLSLHVSLSLLLSLSLSVLRTALVSFPACARGGCKSFSCTGWASLIWHRFKKVLPASKSQPAGPACLKRACYTPPMLGSRRLAVQATQLQPLFPDLTLCVGYECLCVCVYVSVCVCVCVCIILCWCVYRMVFVFVRGEI